jgi:hypothetical protein
MYPEESETKVCILKEGKGREGKGREGKGREGKGREGKGREGISPCEIKEEIWIGPSPPHFYCFVLILRKEVKEETGEMEEKEGRNEGKKETRNCCGYGF